jgi:archaellum component FlaF (FlaF/FlaG flagellin family)
MKVSAPPIGAIIILIVLVICLFIIKTAATQRDERVQWTKDTGNRIVSLNAQLDNANDKVVTLTKELENTKTSFNSSIDAITLSISQKTFTMKTVAGCYGILPGENSTLFNLMCDTSFNRK